MRTITFKPLSRNRYRCNQTGVIVTGTRLQGYKNSVSKSKVPGTRNKKEIKWLRRTSPFGSDYPSYLL